MVGQCKYYQLWRINRRIIITNISGIKQILVLLLIVLFGFIYGQEVELDKESIYGAGSAKSSILLRTENDSVGAVVRSSGIFSIGTTGGRPLLFGYPYTAQTSHTHFYVDGEVKGNYLDTLVGHPLPAEIITAPHLVDSTIICSWNVAGVEFTQTILPVYVGADPQIKIQYDISNTDHITHSAGLLLFLDTMIDSNDCAPIATPLGYFETEQEFIDDIPSFWQAFEQNPFQPPERLVGQGILIGFEATPPDILVYGDFWNYRTTRWDYTFAGGLYSDSAVLLRWNPVPLPPGTSKTIITYYGIGVADRTIGEISMSMTYPEEILPEGCNGFNPDTFVVTLLISAEDTVGGAIATLNTPDFLRLLDEETLSILPTILMPGDMGSASWQVAVEPSAITQIGTLFVELSSPGYSPTTMRREIRLFAPDGEPPIISLISTIPSPVVRDTLTVRFDVSDDSEVDFSSTTITLDGEEIPAEIAGTNIIISLSDLSEGIHQLIVDNISDIYGCESEPYEISLDVELPPAPELTILSPEPGTFSSCEEDTIAIHFNSSAPLSMELSHLTIDGEEIPFAIRADTIFTFATSLSEGTHSIHFLATDEFGLSNELEWQYTIDRTSPRLEPFTEIYTLSSPYDPLQYLLDDAISGVDESSITIRCALDEDTFTFIPDSPGITFSSGNLTIIPGETELEFTGCSHFSLWIIVGDNIQSCGPNILDTLAYSMSIPCTPPDIILLEPEGVSACDTVKVIMLMQDDEEIIADSAWVEFEGHRYDLSSHNLILSSDTLIFKLPSTHIPDGDVSIRIGGIEDSWGNEISAGTSISVTIDRTAPEILGIYPEIELTGTETVRFRCFDEVSGISAEQSYIVCNDDTMSIGYGMGFDGENLFVPSAFWLSALVSDTLGVCAHIFDNVSDCEPNYTDTCVEFIVEQSGPASVIIAPPTDVYLGCDTHRVKLLWFDPDGVDRASSSISINGVSNSASSPMFHWTADTVDFDIATIDEDIIEIILTGYDELGFSSVDTFILRIDKNPPEILSINPLPDDELYQITNSWKIVLEDNLSGIDWRSLSFLVNGNLFTIADEALNVRADTLIFNPGMAGITYYNDTIRCAIYTSDKSFHCANTLDTMWTYTLFTPDFWWELIKPQGVSACETVEVQVVFHTNFDIDFDSLFTAISNNSFNHSHRGDTLNIDIPASFLISGVNTLTVWNITDEEHIVSLPESIFVPILYDGLPPRILPIYPAPGQQISSESSVIALVEDNYTGVDRSGVIIEFDGASYFPDSINWQGDTLIFPLPEQLLGDVQICITASDMPDNCEPRNTRICWEFTIPGAGPDISIIRPYNYQYTHNPRQDILFQVNSENQIDWNTLTITIDQIIYTHNLDYITISGDTVRFAPSQNWSDGDTVRFSIAISDDIGLSSAISSQFICDYSAPVCSEPYPQGIVQNIPDNISVRITDEGVGVDPFSIVFQIEDLFIPYDNYSLTYDHQIATLDLNSAGIHLSPQVGMDTVNICVLATDLNTNLGIPNVMENYCFWFLPVKGGCSVNPKTFTPNNDGFNDIVTFEVYSDYEILVKLFTLEGALVNKLYGNYTITWDGTDNNGKPAPPGPYIYTVESRGKNLCKGTIIIAR